MSTILLMLIFPLGVLFYINEQRSKGKYQAVFDEYIKKVDASADMTDDEKLQRVKELFIANRYDVKEVNKKEIIAQRKILSLGLLFMGLFIYVFYFFFFQKPHTMTYKIK